MSESSDPESEPELLNQYWQQYRQASLNDQFDLHAFFQEVPTEIQDELRRLVEEDKGYSLFNSTKVLPNQSIQFRLRPGQMVDVVQIERLLGEGGMGEVYLGHDTKHNRLVAVKVIQVDKSPTSLVQEIAAMVRLDHPGIVKFLWSVELKNGPWCAIMEFVDAGQRSACSLQELLNVRMGMKAQAKLENGNSDSAKACSQLLPAEFTVQFVAGWLAPVAKALAFAHREGAIHRDIKPANLLLKADERKVLRLIVADWGWSKLAQDGKYSAHTTDPGTFAYRAPETFKGVLNDDTQSNVDHRSDIFSFGMTLFVTLTLQRARDVHDNLLRDKRPPQTNIHPDFDIICAKCLELDPRNRFNDLEIVAEELERIQRGERIKSRPTSWLWRKCLKTYDSRSKWLAFFGLILMLVFSAWIFSWAYYRIRGIQRQSDIDLAGAESLTALTSDRPEVAALKAASAYDIASPVDPRASMIALERFNWSRRSCPITVHSLLWPKQEAERIQFDPAGKFLAARNRSGHWRIWELDTERVVSDLSVDAPITACAWSKNGRRALGYATGTIVIRSMESESSIKIVVPQTPTSIAFHPIENRIAIAHEALVEWNGASGEQTIISDATAGTVEHLEYSPSGTQLLWRDSTGMMALKSVLPKSESAMVSLPHNPKVWLPSHYLNDGKQFVVVSGTSEATIHSATDGKLIARLTAPGRIESLAMAPLTNEIAIGGFGWTKHWADFQGPAIVVTKMYDNDVTSLAWTADNRVLISSCTDETVRGWSPYSKRLSEIRLELNRPILVTSDPHGRYFATCQQEGLIRVWAFPIPVRDQLPFFSPTFVAVSEDGKYFVPSGSHRMNEASTAVRVQTVASSEQEFPEIKITGKLRSAAFRRQDLLLLTQDPNQIEIRNFFTGDLQCKVIPLDSPPVGAAYSPDGSTIVVCADHGDVIVLDANTGEIRHRLNQGGDVVWYMFVPHTWVAFSPDGSRFATWGLSKNVSVWRTEDCNRELTLEHGDVCVGVAFSPDGQYLATAEAGDSSDTPSNATIWNLKAPAIPRRLSHPHWVYSVEYSADGNHLLTACFDHKARIWSVGKEQVIRTFNHTNEVYDATFVPRSQSPAGWPIGTSTEIVATASRDNTMALWDSASGERIAAPMQTNAWPLQIEFSVSQQTLLFAGQGPSVQLVRLACEDDVLPQHLKTSKLTQIAPALFEQKGTVMQGETTGIGDDFAATWTKLRSHVHQYSQDFLSPTGLEQWHQRMANSALHGQKWEEALFHTNLTRQSAVRDRLVESLQSRLPDRRTTIANETAEPLRVQAHAASHRGDIHEAEILIQRVIELGSPTGADFDLRSYLLYKRQNFTESLADGDLAISLGAGVVARRRRSRCLSYLGDWDGALGEMNRLVHEYPDDANIRRERAEVHGYLKHWEACRKDYQVLVDRFGDQVIGRGCYAWACASAEDSEEYVKAAREFLAAHRSQAVPHLIMSCASLYGLCAEMPAEDQAELLKLFQEVWKNDDYYAKLIAGELLYRMGKIDEAIPYLEEAVRRQRNGGTPCELSFLAMCRLNQGQVALANKLLIQARSSLVRMTGPHPRAFEEVEFRSAEIGLTIAWHHIEMYRLAIQEAERQLAATK